ncbi:MAG: LicD family protein [Butyrivibrio sp.]|nr:LicD family protein [Butyrivibrio sp.]
MDRSIDFFRDEVRNGFYIPTAIKQAWAATLDVLENIDKICTKHGIRYFADWGTALGAVRHGGYVPWDDDLDICMLRDDYEKFRQVADEELPDNYVIHDYERKENHWLFLARVVNNSKMCFDISYLDTHNNFPYLAGVDIFIKDYLYEDEEKEKARDREIMELLATAESFIDDPGKRDRAVELYRNAEKKMAQVKPEETKLVGQIFPWILKYGNGSGEKKSLYENIVRLPFEDTTIPMPAHYNELLRSRYGDYCVIKKVWDGHNYPFFEGQKKEMEQISGESLSKFKFDETMLERKAPDKSGSLKQIAKECLAEMERMLKNAFAGDLTQTIGDLQQLAADLGTLIENVKGEKRPCTVKTIDALQAFCDALWEEYNLLSGAETEGNDLPRSRAALDAVMSAVKENVIDRKEVLFISIGPREWKSFERYYEKATADEDTDVFVVPLPLMRKTYLGEIRMTDEEIHRAVRLDEYPDGVEYTDYVTYDITLHAPETVYIHNPYDGTNPCLTVPSSFYCENVRKYADKIIYIPVADTAEFGPQDVTDIYNMGHYVTAPGVVFADKVIVQSENIKRRYVEVLTAFAGEKTKEIWEKKTEVREALSANDTNAEKRLLVCIGANELAECEGSFAELIKNKLEIIKNAGGKIKVSVLLYPDDEADYAGFEEADHHAVSEILHKAAKEGIIDIVSASPRFADEVSKEYAAYYGSPSPFVPAFSVLGKPVMIADFRL